MVIFKVSRKAWLVHWKSVFLLYMFEHFGCSGKNHKQIWHGAKQNERICTSTQCFKDANALY